MLLFKDLHKINTFKDHAYDTANDILDYILKQKGIKNIKTLWYNLAASFLSFSMKLTEDEARKMFKVKDGESFPKNKSMRRFAEKANDERLNFDSVANFFTEDSDIDISIISRFYTYIVIDMINNIDKLKDIHSKVYHKYRWIMFQVGNMMCEIKSIKHPSTFVKVYKQHALFVNKKKFDFTSFKEHLNQFNNCIIPENIFIKELFRLAFMIFTLNDNIPDKLNNMKINMDNRDMVFDSICLLGEVILRSSNHNRLNIPYCCYLSCSHLDQKILCDKEDMDCFRIGFSALILLAFMTDASKGISTRVMIHKILNSVF